VASDAQANYLRFRLSPHSMIGLAARVKSAGRAFVGEQHELVLSEDGSSEQAPYERLLADALAGDPALFTREDAVEAAWRVVEPVLNPPAPVILYPQGSWGPLAAEHLFAGDGGWQNPDAAT
jgi:glucose-6-phosphate 1-dehydrogenase